MDKNALINTLKDIRTSSYTWSLYFFRIDRRNSNPYTAYKVRFKNNHYLPDYANTLMQMILEYQLEKIDEIREYTGENTKISCDMIETNSELVKKQWDYMVMDIAEASDEKIEGKYHGYILEGVSLNNTEKSAVFLKMANPIINLKNKRSAVFTFNADSELAELSDDVCKLQMNADCIVIDEIIYSFNYRFENLFNIEKTMQKIKNKALDEIVAIDAFDDREQFEKIARAYKSPRTFITLKRERVDRIKNRKERKKVADMLKIDISTDEKFQFKNDEEVSLLIKYLCYKIFKDEETKELLEANNVTQVVL